jgi:hypothetical protein
MKPLSEYYSRKAVNSTKGEYTYYVPECRKCTSARASKWKRDNKKLVMNIPRKDKKKCPSTTKE